MFCVTLCKRGVSVWGLKKIQRNFVRDLRGVRMLSAYNFAEKEFEVISRLV